MLCTAFKINEVSFTGLIAFIGFYHLRVTGVVSGSLVWPFVFVLVAKVLALLAC